jgi:glyoxylase-like metal-dependent hydrolase (beta-lactamase superfamily II)
MMTSTILDTQWQGRAKSVGAVLLESNGHRSIIDPGPASTLPTLRAELQARGLAVADLHAILLTHIHMDHAAATGTLVQENPNLEVYVHKNGMMHMADPSKLLASAERLWPGKLGVLYGEMLPVPFGNMRILKGGETLELGGRKIEVIYTPGHASHHVSFFDASDGTAYVGDTAGFHVEGQARFGGRLYVTPVAPPPDIDLELWDESIKAILRVRPARLGLTHYGYSGDPAEHLANLWENLRHWSEVAGNIVRSTANNDDGLKAFAAATSAEVQQRLAPADAEHCLFNVAPYLTWLGLSRYHRKRAEAAQQAGAN